MTAAAQPVIDDSGIAEEDFVVGNPLENCKNKYLVLHCWVLSVESFQFLVGGLQVHSRSTTGFYYNDINFALRSIRVANVMDMIWSVILKIR